MPYIVAGHSQMSSGAWLLIACDQWAMQVDSRNFTPSPLDVTGMLSYRQIVNLGTRTICQSIRERAERRGL